MVGFLHFLKLVPVMFLTLAIVSSQTIMCIILKAVLRSLSRLYLPGAATKHFFVKQCCESGSGTFYPDLDPELFISDPYLGYNRYITKIILFLL